MSDKFMSIFDFDTLYPVVNSLRCIKSEAEINLMREVCSISSKAHIYAMVNCMPTFQEFQLAALFREYFAYAGADDTAYFSVCGGGRNASVLHYEVNTEELNDGDLVLCDMGAKKDGMCSDITCTYPVNGKFTQIQKDIYNIVLEAQTSSIKMLKPGVAYADIQDNSFKVILKGLTKLGILKGDQQKMFEAKVHKIFMPHRLGHYLGFRTHDVGKPRKNLKPEDIEYNKQYLSVDEDILEENMCLTVEPGIYFIQSLAEKAKNDPDMSDFFDFDKLQEYWSVGGVRIEDDLRITSDGYENFTKVKCLSKINFKCPRTVEEIEKVMAQGKYVMPSHKIWNKT